jgi:hypothetical protein
MRVAACLLTGTKKQATCFDSVSKEFVSPLSSTRRQSPSVRCEERIEEQGIITKLDIRWVSNQFPNEIQSTMIPKPKDVGKFAWNLWKYEPPNNTDETSIQIVNQKQKNVQLRTFLLTSKYKSIREKLLFRPETGQLTHHSITHHKRLRKRRSKNYITNNNNINNRDDCIIYSLRLFLWMPKAQLHFPSVVKLMKKKRKRQQQQQQQQQQQEEQHCDQKHKFTNTHHAVGRPLKRQRLVF